MISHEYPNCIEGLRRSGKAYPRTCKECGLGPCKALPKAAPPVAEAIPAQRKGEIPTAPDKCPISGRAFWGNISHPTLGYVATYGGPFDTYTIPYLDEDDELRVERFDQDRGEWVEGGEPFGWFYREQQPEAKAVPAQAAIQKDINTEVFRRLVGKYVIASKDDDGSYVWSALIKHINAAMTAYGQRQYEVGYINGKTSKGA